MKILSVSWGQEVHDDYDSQYVLLLIINPKECQPT